MSINNKKKCNILFIIIGLFILIIACVFLYKFVNRDLVYKNSVSIKIGDSIPQIENYVDNKELERLENKKIEWKNINIEDNKIYYAGKYTGYITFKNKKIKIVLEVIDDENPIIEGVEDITIFVDEEIDLLKNIITNDNSHDEVLINVNGEYDTSTAGEYNLSYVAKDKSGNETIKEFKLIVKEDKKIINKHNNSNNNENVVVGTSSKGYTIKRENGIYYVNDILVANKTYDLSSNYAPGGLLNIFMDAFYNMQTYAVSQGISLSIISGYRSYNSQHTIYNNYVNKDGKSLADTYSARPGHSEHQTGLAADINSLSQSFINTDEGKWLNDNCYKYGFIIRYPQGKESITGYMYEPWHIRYVGVDVATDLYNGGNWISLEEYLGITSQYSY